MSRYMRVGKLSYPNMFFHVKFQKVNDYITHVLFVGQPSAYCILSSAATILTYYDQQTGYIIASSTLEYNDDFEYEYETIVENADIMSFWLEEMKPNGIKDLRMMNNDGFFVFSLTRELVDNVVHRPGVLDALLSSNSGLSIDIALEIYRHVQNNKKQDVKKCISDAFMARFPFSVQVLITNKGWFTYQIIEYACIMKNEVLCNRCFSWKVSKKLSEFCYGLEHASTQECSQTHINDA